MSPVSPDEYHQALVRGLCALPDETEWVEFKENDETPHEIGEYVSALANSAALAGKEWGYLVWGVRDRDHAIVGTSFDPASTKKGNEDLVPWLLRLLDPGIEMQFTAVEVNGARVVVLSVPRASHQPIKFSGTEYVRVGSYKKRLADYPEKERLLWQVFQSTAFEEGTALERATDADVLTLLDVDAYFALLKSPRPANPAGLLDVLAGERLVIADDASTWRITNLGAILFAKRLADFDRLGRKVVRVIAYEGTNRIKARKEHVVDAGYASGFEYLVAFINGLLPSNEVIEHALRKTVPMYPPPAVRELLANALIHQDFSISGAGPMVELFSDRLEITNPGTPLVETARFLDAPPRSRNERIASLARRMGLCEERGSGIDRVVFLSEAFHLPPPLFEVVYGSTRASLFAPRPLNRMDRDERIRACYLHAGLRYVSNEFLTNASLRARFRLDDKNSATASRLIKEAVEAGQIGPVDETAAKKFMKYVPWWAALAPRREAGA